MEAMPANDFKLIAGHPSLDFINTLDNRFAPDGPLELLQSYRDLLRFVGQCGLIEPSILESIGAIGLEDLELQALERSRALRETLAALHYGRLVAQVPSDDDLDHLSEFQKVVSQRRRLAPVPDGFEWKWTEAEFDVSLPVWAVADSACRLLTSPSLQFVRACECSSCRWLFLDSSKNHARRWCDMKLCGNRMKARRYLDRRAEA